MKRICFALTASLLAGSAASASSVTIFTDEASFRGATGTLIAETFDPIFDANGAFGIPGDSTPTSVGAFSISQSFGGGASIGTFDPKVDNGQNSTSDYEIDPDGLAYLQLRSEGDPVFLFDTPIVGFGATFNSISSQRPTLTVAGESFDLFEILGSAPAEFAAPSQNGGFFGFVLDHPVESFEISSGRADTIALDNALVAPVPLPAGGLLLGSVVLVGALRRRGR